MKKNLRILCCLFILPLLLTACGFHLRGQNKLPNSLKVLSLNTNTPYGSLETTLRQTLKASGITTCLPDSNNPPCQSGEHIVLALSIPIKDNANLTTLDSSNQARIFTLNYQVTITLLKHNKPFVGPLILKASRTIRLGANQPWQLNNQVQVLNHMMEQDIVGQLYGVLSSEQASDQIKS